MTTSTAGAKDRTTRFWDVATKLALAVTIAACTAVINHEIRISQIEESRANINEWLRSDIAELKSILKEMRSDFETRLRYIEAKVR